MTVIINKTLTKLIGNGTLQKAFFFFKNIIIIIIIIIFKFYNSIDSMGERGIESWMSPLKRTQGGVS